MLRQRVGAGNRALTCSALKPQGFSPATLAELAQKFAAGGVDYIKDDHGLAGQDFSPFAARVEAIAKALTPYPRTRYVPSLSGDLGTMRRKLAAAAAVGIDTAMVAPMVCGLANFHRLADENPGFAFVAHPALAGAPRIAPALLMGKLFRLVGADAVVFPNHGGRFGYSPETCRALARAALADWHGLHACLPVAAGGMTVDRVSEMLDFYGADIMLLIGGGLLRRASAWPKTAAFVVLCRVFVWMRSPKKRHASQGAARLPLGERGVASYKEDERALFSPSRAKSCSPTPTCTANCATSTLRRAGFHLGGTRTCTRW